MPNMTIPTLTTQVIQLRSLINENRYLPDLKALDDVTIAKLTDNTFIITHDDNVVGTINYHSDHEYFMAVVKAMNHANCTSDNWDGIIHRDINRCHSEVHSFIKWASLYDTQYFLGMGVLDNMANNLITAINEETDNTLTMYEVAGCPNSLLSEWTAKIDNLLDELNFFRLHM